MCPLCDSQQPVGYKLKSSHSVQGWYMRDDFMVFRISTTIMLCSDIKTEMVKHKICLLSPTLSNIDHVDNTVKDRSRPISCRCLWIMHSFSVTSANITTSHIFLKARFFGLHFSLRRYTSIFNHFDIIGPQSFRIWRNNPK